MEVGEGGGSLGRTPRKGVKQGNWHQGERRTCFGSRTDQVGHERQRPCSCSGFKVVPLLPRPTSQATLA